MNSRDYASARPAARALADAAQQPASRPRIVIAVDPDGRRDNPILHWIYRVLEFITSFIALIVFLPVMLIVAIIIKLDTPGPALFVQWRCGRSRVMRGSELLGRTDLVSATGRFEPDKLYWVPTMFRFIKFRTMYVDAQERFPDFYARRFNDHAEFRAGFYKLDDDPRVTPAGRWLRRITVDELPNFWNIVAGNIGLVGPRPEGPAFLPYYTAQEMRKFTVRPGITGMAVIKGRGKLNIGDQIEWDLRYVQERSVMLDVKILFATAWLILVRKGAF